MKKLYLLLVITIACFLSVSTHKVDLKASEFENVPYDTKVVGLEGNLVSSSVAYNGVSIFSPNLVGPSDICIDDNDNLFIADREGGKVLRYDTKTNTYITIGLKPTAKDEEEEKKIDASKYLAEPAGVAVDSDFNLYVADYKHKSIYVYSYSSNYETIIDKYTINPKTEPLYGTKNDFKPLKVSVDKAKNIYVVSEANSRGVVRISPEHEFMGYFAPNTVKVSFEVIKQRLFNKIQGKDPDFGLNPKTNTNVFVDHKNVLYTLVYGETDASLKKYNINGTNILAGNPFFTKTYQDITVDKNGFIYTVDNEDSGCISVLDDTGDLLFKFGNTVPNSMSIGQFNEANGIAVDSKGNIWVLDGSSKNIQLFVKTSFAQKVIDAKMYYNDGLYEDALRLYEDIIKDNSSFVEAYRGLGEIAQRNMDHKAAIKYFEIANDFNGYSEAYWEIRDEFIGNNLAIFLILIIGIVVIYSFKLHTKLAVYIPQSIKDTKTKIKNSTLYMELSYFKRMLKKPFDVLYDIKYQHKIRFKTAFALFITFIAIVILSDYVISGYLFRKGVVGNVNIGFEILKWFLIIFLFTVANHLISSLQNGEGFFRDIFIGTIYSLAPLFLFYLPLAILSNVLTYNEGFIMSLASLAIWGWSILNIVITVKEIHNYKIKELIVNFVLTALTMIIIILLFLIVYILFMQFYDVTIGIISEVFR